MIKLRFLEGQSVAQVAQPMGKSEGVIVALPRRALDALRVSMERMGE